jgi:hypothetical protein
VRDGDSSFETDLTGKFRDSGVEEGVKKFLAQYPGRGKAKAEMVVNSFRSHPRDAEKPHQYEHVYSKE